MLQTPGVTSWCHRQSVWRYKRLTSWTYDVLKMMSSKLLESETITVVDQRSPCTTTYFPFHHRHQPLLRQIAQQLLRCSNMPPQHCHQCMCCHGGVCTALRYISVRMATIKQGPLRYKNVLRATGGKLLSFKPAKQMRLLGCRHRNGT